MNKTGQIMTTVILVGAYFTLSVASPLSMHEETATHCDKTLEDQNLPDRKDCARYFRCVYGRMVPKECPEKMLFNSAIGNCDLYYNVECVQRLEELEAPEDDLTEAIESLTGRPFVKPSKTPRPTSSIASETSIERNSFTGETSTLKFVYFPHESDQSAYYKIENGAKILVHCEAGKVFSFDLEICARPWSV
uniref:Chitin-binding type-2 domain-containing protein n=1 Tax=Dendroctonus ponderosae TaxID=77166 RepID=A0AAR5Q8U5_DENPD